MPSVLFLLLRRMRLPLIILICVYAISILGLVLIPGQDDQGNPWSMDFFHAFYFVSYMGSTIGFGEIPYPFTDAQRLWTTFIIYVTVIAWLYSIGSLLTILQDPAFRKVMRQSRFERSVKRLREPFYLICGYGDTGSLLVRSLTNRGLRVVVIDLKMDHIETLSLEDLQMQVPGLCADAADPEILRVSGLTHRRCAGLVAITDDDSVNLNIALAGKLLAPRVPVICNAEHRETASNMASFGTDFIINPFETFAGLLKLSIESPHIYTLYEWLTNPRIGPIPDPVRPPRGTWVLCGYGRFGKAVSDSLRSVNIKPKIIELLPDTTSAPTDTIKGKGTEASTLLRAGVEIADAIIAGTDNDADNLSILMTARELNRNLFIVSRQSHRRTAPLFHAARPHLIIQPARVVARKVLALIQNPLLADFLQHMREQDDAWARHLIKEMWLLAGDRDVDTWTVRINKYEAPAVYNRLVQGQAVKIAYLLRDPYRRDERMPGLAMMLKRDDIVRLEPEGELELNINDELLIGGLLKTRETMDWILSNVKVLEYVVTGEALPDNLIRRWISRRYSAH